MDNQEQQKEEKAQQRQQLNQARQAIGSNGEEIAALYLSKNGYFMSNIDLRITFHISDSVSSA